MSGPIVLHVAAVEFTATRLLLPQMSHQQDAGYDVRLVCAPEGESFGSELQRFDPVAVTFPRSLDVVGMARGAVALERLVRRMEPAVVHFHTPAASLPGRPLLALRGRRRPRVVYTAHGLLQTFDTPTLRDRSLDRFERLLSRWTDALLFQSAEDHAHAKQARYRGELVHLGNGVGDDWFSIPPVTRTPGPLNALYVGRLVREKGVLDLLEAAAKVPDVRWTLVGDALPSDRDSVVEEVDRVAAASDGRIRKLGMLPPSAVREQMAGADLLVLPSWREGVPRSVIEGMASGRPVVATDIRGCRELVSPGHNGWIVPARDPEALARALREAQSLPPERLAALGAAGRERAHERHRESLVFERIEATYRKLGVVP